MRAEKVHYPIIQCAFKITLSVQCWCKINQYCVYIMCVNLQLYFDPMCFKPMNVCINAMDIIRLTSKYEYCSGTSPVLNIDPMTNEFHGATSSLNNQ